MHGKMIFVLLLSGYIFTKAVATTTPKIGVTTTTSASLSTDGSISTTPSGPKKTPPSTPVPTTEKEEAARQRYPHNFSQPVITVIIYSVMAVIIGIILISAQLIGLLIKRNPTLGTSDPLTSVKIGETV
ncbi:glycophorin-A isoform X1 [Sagmatias obliquidens]|uniref:glycophorin-A isoform X1 n=1 Tax=Sagmatias obliquidens TaxID=3371155 RepID=UPI000F44185B|nr:glycophorin-A isoform X1 [Lagenorhynchus obliquidens]